MIYILEELSNGDLSIENLYTNTQEYFEGIDEFIFSLDVLYILDSIQVDFEEGVVKYVSRD